MESRGTVTTIGGEEANPEEEELETAAPVAGSRVRIGPDTGLIHVTGKKRKTESRWNDV